MSEGLSFTINVRRTFILEIFENRSDISILVAFSSGHFRSSGSKVSKIEKLIVNDPLSSYQSPQERINGLHNGSVFTKATLPL